MKVNKLVRRVIVGWLTLALALTGCTTAQLQKRYTNFDGCFKEQKVIATAGGAILGALVGSALGGHGGKGAAIAMAGAVLGGVIGNRVAWQSCLTAFPIVSKTSVINDRPSTMAEGGLSATQAISKSVVIRDVSTGPLVFGRDLDVTVTYSYISANPATRDIKAHISRNLLFTAPDGSRQEVASSSDDIIQQGVSRATFAIPTPSLQEAEELKSTTDWAFKFVVETDGMREEKVTPLNVGQLSADASQMQPVSAIVQTSTSAPNQAPPKSMESVNLKNGTVLLKEANSRVIRIRLKSASSAIVLQRTVQGSFHWVHVRLPDGTEGWFRGARQ